MKIQVTFQMDESDEFADPDHEMGVTNAGYEYLIAKMPGYDVEVKRVVK